MPRASPLMRKMLQWRKPESLGLQKKRALPVSICSSPGHHRLGYGYLLWILFPLLLGASTGILSQRFLIHSLWVHDLDHTRSLASFQWSGLSDHWMLLLTENCLQFQRWYPKRGEEWFMSNQLVRQSVGMYFICWMLCNPSDPLSPPLISFCVIQVQRFGC